MVHQQFLDITSGLRVLAAVSATSIGINVMKLEVEIHFA